MEIQISSRFERHYKKLQKQIRAQARQKETIFRGNPFDPRLKTHKLAGEEKGAWAFWINYRYRITFIFLTENAVLFLDIGTHSIYK